MTAYAVITTPESGPRPQRTNKITISPDDACAEAEKYLLKAGFVFVRQSTVSEARYYAFPGRHAVLRVATHKKAARNPRLIDGPTVASITFSHNATRNGGLKISHNFIEWHTATAIGIYMMRSDIFKSE